MICEAATKKAAEIDAAREERREEARFAFTYGVCPRCGGDAPLLGSWWKFMSFPEFAQRACARCGVNWMRVDGLR